MMRVCKILILLVLCTFTVIGQAQEDSVKTDTVRVMDNNPYRFRIRQIILPATLIGVGIIGLESHWLQYQNRELRDELRETLTVNLRLMIFAVCSDVCCLWLEFVWCKRKA